MSKQRVSLVWSPAFAPGAVKWPLTLNPDSLPPQIPPGAITMDETLCDLYVKPAMWNLVRFGSSDQNVAPAVTYPLAESDTYPDELVQTGEGFPE